MLGSVPYGRSKVQNFTYQVKILISTRKYNFAKIVNKLSVLKCFSFRMVIFFVACLQQPNNLPSSSHRLCVKCAIKNFRLDIGVRACYPMSKTSWNYGFVSVVVYQRFPQIEVNPSLSFGPSIKMIRIVKTLYKGRLCSLINFLFSFLNVYYIISCNTFCFVPFVIKVRLCTITKNSHQNKY